MYNHTMYNSSEPFISRFHATWSFKALKLFSSCNLKLISMSSLGSLGNLSLHHESQLILSVPPILGRVRSSPWRSLAMKLPEAGLFV